MWWRIGRVEVFQPERCGFESRSSLHVWILGKSLTHSCVWRFDVKLRHSIRAVPGALLSSSGMKGRYRNDLNEWKMTNWLDLLYVLVRHLLPPGCGWVSAHCDKNYLLISKNKYQFKGNVFQWVGYSRTRLPRQDWGHWNANSLYMGMVVKRRKFYAGSRIYTIAPEVS